MFIVHCSHGATLIFDDVFNGGPAERVILGVGFITICLFHIEQVSFRMRRCTLATKSLSS